MKVWVCRFDVPYEGSELVGLYESVEGAKAGALFHTYHEELNWFEYDGVWEGTWGRYASDVYRVYLEEVNP